MPNVMPMHRHASSALPCLLLVLALGVFCSLPLSTLVVAKVTTRVFVRLELVSGAVGVSGLLPDFHKPHGPLVFLSCNFLLIFFVDLDLVVVVAVLPHLHLFHRLLLHLFTPLCVRSHDFSTFHPALCFSILLPLSSCSACGQRGSWVCMCAGRTVEWWSAQERYLSFFLCIYFCVFLLMCLCIFTF